MAERTGLSINLDVIESMAAMAALEVNGVSSMAAKTVHIKNAFNSKPVFKPVRAEIKNGAVVINLHICISKNANAKVLVTASTAEYVMLSKTKPEGFELKKLEEVVAECL